MKAWGDPEDDASAARGRDETLRAIDEAGIDLDPASPAELAAHRATGDHTHDHDPRPHQHPHVQSSPGEPPVIGIVGAGAVGTALGVALDQVSVKAKTAERLGPVGRGEGMEARAVCLLWRSG